MPSRAFGNAARYGFNGKERDKDLHSLTAYDYGFRIYNPAIGRFLSVDPLMKGYPSWSPYPYAMNRPIDGIDLDGLEFYKIFFPGFGLPFKVPGLKNSYADDVIDGFYERAKGTVMGLWDMVTGNGKGGRINTKRAFGSSHTGIANDVQNMGDPMYMAELFTGFVEGVITDYANLIQETFKGDGKNAGALLFEALMFMMPEEKGATAGKIAEDGIKAFDQAIDAIKNGQRSFSDLENVAVQSKTVIVQRIQCGLPISTDGKLLGKISQGEIKMFGKTKAAGEFDFVVTLDGEILLGRKHSFLSQGADVQAAGTLKIRGGKIIRINNLSGHYLPNLEQSSKFLRILKNNGANIDNAHFQIYDANGNIIKHLTPSKR